MDRAARIKGKTIAVQERSERNLDWRTATIAEEAEEFDEGFPFYDYFAKNEGLPRFPSPS